MRSRFPLVVAFVVGAFFGWPRLPAVVGLDAPAGAFSAERAMAHVRAWAAAPRPSGSAANAAVRDSVAAALSGLGFVVTREPFGTGMENLVARRPGVASRAAGVPAGGLWLVAHVDSVPESPGAADDGLGLGVVVEAARALSGDAGPDLHILVTDGEELGLLGAQAHLRAEAARGPAPPRLVVNVEARGTEGPAYMFQTAGPPGALLDRWQAAGCRAQATSLAKAVYDALPNDTDFTVFRAAGWWGYDFALIHGAWRYHTPDDTPANLDPRSVQQVGDCVVGLARAWAASDAAAPPRPAAGGADPVYAQLGGRTVVLPPWVVRVFGGMTALGLLVAAREGARPGRAAFAGASAWAIALVGAFGGGFGLLHATAALRPDFWERPAEVVRPDGLYLLAVAFGVVVAVLALALARRVAPDAARGWHLGAGLVGAGLAVGLPTVGYVFVPGAQVSAALLRGRPGLAVPPAFLAGVLCAPVLHALFPALTTRMMPVLCVVPALLLAWFVRVPPPAAR